MNKKKNNIKKYLLRCYQGNRKNAGITLIALIITIVVLLILAGITINMVLGENGIFNKAKTSVAKYENAQEKENSALGKYENEINNYINGNRESKPVYPDYKSATEVLYTEWDSTFSEKTYTALEDGYIHVNVCCRNCGLVKFYIDSFLLGCYGGNGFSDAIWDVFSYPIKKGSTFKACKHEMSWAKADKVWFSISFIPNEE